MCVCDPDTEVSRRFPRPRIQGRRHPGGVHPLVGTLQSQRSIEGVGHLGHGSRLRIIPPTRSPQQSPDRDVGPSAFGSARKYSRTKGIHRRQSVAQQARGEGVRFDISLVNLGTEVKEGPELPPPEEEPASASEARVLLAMQHITYWPG